jgi:four helix bundle protein
MFNFENLNIYKESIIFTQNIYDLLEKFPKYELFCLSNQLRRAAISIALNIAEGSSRTKKDFRHFLDISRGSCFECVAILEIAKNKQYITQEEFSLNYEFCVKLSKMISSLKKSLL